MTKSRCKQCRKRLALPDGSGIEFCSGACRDRHARLRGAPHYWPQFPGEPCRYCGCGIIRYGVTCGSDVCAKSNQLYMDAYLRTGGQLDRVDYRLIVEKSGGQCGICHGPLTGEASVDHIYPLAHGGAHTLANLQLAHRHCNTAKGNRIPEGAL